MTFEEKRKVCVAAVRAVMTHSDDLAEAAVNGADIATMIILAVCDTTTRKVNENKRREVLMIVQDLIAKHVNTYLKKHPTNPLKEKKL